ncbi:MAG: NAD(P)/FAD-dependent oxidoreductase [Pseudomonadota bacterium]
MTTPTHITDIVIIGAGPVGLFAIFECGMLRLKCHVIDALEMAGGQCSALYPQKPIYDIPGFPKISAQGLIDNLKEQAAPFEPIYHFGQQVQKVTPAGSGRFEVETANGTKINAGAIIIAAGVGAFGPNRPPLKGLESYEDKSVFYYVKDPEQFRDKRIMIAGGGDSAIDWALALSDVASRVSLVHRRPKFRAAPESVAQMKKLKAQGKINVIIPYQLAGLSGQDGQLDAVILQNMEGEERRVEADVLLPFYGLAMNLGPIADWGLNLDQKHITVNPETCSTNIDGIFAIGDIATYPAKLKLILTGFAEAAHAAHAARAKLHPDQNFHFEYSTTSGVPGTQSS